MLPVLSLVAVFVFPPFLAGQEINQSINMSPPAWTLGEFIHRGHWWKNRGQSWFSAFVYNQFSVLVNRHFNPKPMSDTPASDV